MPATSGTAGTRGRAGATGATAGARDPVVDLLRAGSIVVVVVGHVVMAVAVWTGPTLKIDNVLRQVPALQPATWVFQVMPVFFAAGAVAGRISWSNACAAGTPWRAWIWHRVARLVRPLFAYVATWLVLGVVLEAVRPAEAGAIERLSTQLLWFVAAYVLVVAATPVIVRLATAGFVAVGALLAAVAVADLARFEVLHALGYATFVLVLVLAPVTGIVVRDHLGDRRLLARVCAGAFAMSVAAVTWLPYPVSLVGLPGKPAVNTDPPSVVFALYTVMLVSLLGLCWGALARLCERPMVARIVTTVGGLAMTLYLWHMTALLAVIAVEHEIALDRGPRATSLPFWAATVLQVVVVLAVTAALVPITAGFERIPIPWLEHPTARRGGRAWNAVAAAGVVAVALGTATLSATGTAGFPFGRVSHSHGVALTPGLGIVLFAAGVLLAREAGRRRLAAVHSPGPAAH